MSPKISAALPKVAPQRANKPAIKPAALPEPAARSTGWAAKARATAASVADSFSPAASKPSTRPTENATALADTLSGLKDNLDKASKAFEHVGKAQYLPGGDALESFAESTGNVSDALGKVANQVGDAAAALRIPAATRELNSAFDAYQRNPSPANASRLQQATEGWRAVITPFAEKIPNPAIRAEVVGMLEIASKAVGNFAVLVSDYAARAARAAESDPQAQPVAAREADSPTANFSAEVIAQREQNREAATRDPGSFAQAQVSQWLGRVGLTQMPPAMQEKYDALQDTASALEQNRAARAKSWNPFKNAELDEAARLLKITLMTQAADLQGAASSARRSESMDFSRFFEGK